MVCVTRAPTKGGTRRIQGFTPTRQLSQLGCYGAFPRIARSGPGRKVCSGAALSCWPVEPQGLHKRNKTWGLSGDLSPDRAQQRVCLCQRRRICRLISTHCAFPTLQPHSRKRNRPMPALFVVLHRTHDQLSVIHMLSCQLLVLHKRCVDCAKRSGPRVDKQERVSAAVNCGDEAWTGLSSASAIM